MPFPLGRHAPDQAGPPVGARRPLLGLARAQPEAEWLSPGHPQLPLALTRMPRSDALPSGPTRAATLLHVPLIVTTHRRAPSTALARHTLSRNVLLSAVGSERELIRKLGSVPVGVAATGGVATVWQLGTRPARLHRTRTSWQGYRCKGIVTGGIPTACFQFQPCPSQQGTIHDCNQELLATNPGHACLLNYRCCFPAGSRVVGYGRGRHPSTPQHSDGRPWDGHAC